MKNVFITGCGRSGTSMLAGMFASASYYFGEAPYPPRYSNPKGFFESPDINGLNEDIIRASLSDTIQTSYNFSHERAYEQGHLWLARFPLDMKFYASLEQMERIKTILSNQPFCFKDPRFCFTIEKWIPFANNYVILCIFRDPQKTVESILEECKRSQYLHSLRISIEELYAVWREMYLRILKIYCTQSNIYFVSYNDVVEGKIFDELENIVGTPIDRSFPDRHLDRSESDIPRNYESSLVFEVLQQISRDDLGENRTSLHLEAILKLEHAISRKGIHNVDYYTSNILLRNELKKMLSSGVKNSRINIDELAERLVELDSLKYNVIVQDKIIEEKDTTIVNHADMIKNLSETSEKQHRAISGLQRRIEQYGAESAQRESMIARLQDTIDEQECAIVEGRRLMADLQRRIEQYGAESAQRESTIARLQEMVDDVHAARRAFAPLRWLQGASRIMPRIARGVILAVGGTNAQRLDLLRRIYRRLPVPVRVRDRLKTYAMRKIPSLRRALLSLSNTALLSTVDGRCDTALQPVPDDPPWILIAELRIPTPDLTSGSVRLDAIIHLLLEMGYQITFASHASKRDYHWIFSDEEQIQPYEERLRNSGIEVYYGDDEIIDYLSRYGYKYSYVFLSYPDVAYRYLPVVRGYAINAILIYDTVDLHGIRFERESKIKNDRSILEQSEYYKKIESFNVECSDVVIAITEEEKKSILDIDRSAEVCIIPNIHECRSTPVRSEYRNGLLFIGHYLHSPNEDAVRYFIQEILPLIRRSLPDVVFRILGSSMPQEIKSLGSSYIEPIGFVEDPEPYFDQSRVFVAPLRYGAGMKGKIGQSLSFGLPVVTTSIGAEGMQLTHNRNVLISDTPESFAREVVRLYTDDTLWEKLSDNGLRHIQENFSSQAIKKKLAAIFDRVRD